MRARDGWSVGFILVLTCSIRTGRSWRAARAQKTINRARPVLARIGQRTTEAMGALFSRGGVPVGRNASLPYRNREMRAASSNAHAAIRLASNRFGRWVWAANRYPGMVSIMAAPHARPSGEASA